MARRIQAIAHRPFRFGIITHNTSPSKEDLVAKARKAEQLGYNIFLVPDHLGDQFAPSLALMLIASVTTTLRIGSGVFDNDFRHPALLAKEVATLDNFSGGRFELGIGAGWMRSEYEQIGMTFDKPSLRIGRLREALHVLKSFFTEESVTFAGQHYHLQGMPGLPKSSQSPYPPIHLGGSGKKMLTIAAQEADIVGIIPSMTTGSPAEHMNEARDSEDASAEMTLQKVAWIREAAGDRFNQLELNIIPMEIAVTEDRQQAIEKCARRLHMSERLTAEMPFLLLGSVEQISEQLLLMRETYGFSYIVVWEEYMEALGPVVARLANR
jgi:probable F420-dependent oxidoreductase